MNWTLLPLVILVVLGLVVFAIMGTVLSVIGAVVIALLSAVFAVLGVLLKLIFTPLVGLLFLGALIWFLVYRRRETPEIKS